jgi:hypothetical protein
MRNMQKFRQSFKVVSNTPIGREDDIYVFVHKKSTVDNILMLIDGDCDKLSDIKGDDQLEVLDMCYFLEPQNTFKLVWDYILLSLISIDIVSYLAIPNHRKLYSFSPFLSHWSKRHLWWPHAMVELLPRYISRIPSISCLKSIFGVTSVKGVLIDLHINIIKTQLKLGKLIFPVISIHDEPPKTITDLTHATLNQIFIHNDERVQYWDNTGFVRKFHEYNLYLPDGKKIPVTLKGIDGSPELKYVLLCKDGKPVNENYILSTLEGVRYNMDGKPVIVELVYDSAMLVNGFYLMLDNINNQLVFSVMKNERARYNSVKRVFYKWDIIQTYIY